MPVNSKVNSEISVAASMRSSLTLSNGRAYACAKLLPKKMNNAKEDWNRGKREKKREVEVIMSLRRQNQLSQ